MSGLAQRGQSGSTAGRASLQPAPGSVPPASFPPSPSSKVPPRPEPLEPSRDASSEAAFLAGAAARGCDCCARAAAEGGSGGRAAAAAAEAALAPSPPAFPAASVSSTAVAASAAAVPSWALSGATEASLDPPLALFLLAPSGSDIEFAGVSLRQDVLPKKSEFALKATFFSFSAAG